MRVFIAVALAWLLAIAGPSSAQMTLTGAGSVKAKATAPPAAAYSFLGALNPDTSSVSTVITVPVTIGPAAANRVILFGVGIQNGQVITSVVIDPAGTPVSLTNVVTDGAAITSFWSGVDATHTGATNIQITFATSINFNNLAIVAWQMTGLGSTSSRQSSSSDSGPTGTINVTNTDFLFAMQSTGGSTGYDYSTSTVAPNGVHADSGNIASSADWIIAASNASFAVTPKSGVGTVLVMATWR